MKYHVGTSGWSYKEWKGEFYPKELSGGEYLKYYSRKFRTVELNNTFYMLPSEEQFAKWRDQTPRHFLFSVKASRFITHRKRLLDAREALQNFFSRIEGLKEKCGPILFQLPPNLKKDEKRLEAFLKLLPRKHLYTVEFRNPDWFVPGIYRLLEKYSIAFCMFDLGKFFSPRVVTSNFVYLRLHGRKLGYKGNYSKRTLENWKNWIDKQPCRQAFIYFDNTDEQAHAILNAGQMKELV